MGRRSESKEERQEGHQRGGMAAGEEGREEPGEEGGTPERRGSQREVRAAGVEAGEKETRLKRGGRGVSRGGRWIRDVW
jgi:hypothetical protein